MRGISHQNFEKYQQRPANGLFDPCYSYLLGRKAFLMADMEKLEMELAQVRSAMIEAEQEPARLSLIRRMMKGSRGLRRGVQPTGDELAAMAKFEGLIRLETTISTRLDCLKGALKHLAYEYRSRVKERLRRLRKIMRMAARTRP